VRVTLADPARPCKPGDLIELNCLVPARERTILWRLAQYDIRLRNEWSEHRYYNFETLVNEDSPAATAAMLAEMIARIRRSGREHADVAQLQGILAAGRYKGRKVADIMVGATNDELGDFFRFVLSYPGKYMGHTWRIDEVFAVWVINGAPYSTIELADAVVAANSDTRRQQLLAVDPSLRADTLSELLRRARALGNDRKFDPARSLLVLVGGLRRPVDDPRIALELQFSRGKHLKQTDSWRKAASQFEQTLDDCRRAKPLPEPARWVESAAYLQLGDALKKLGNHEGALAAYKNGARVQKAHGAGLEARAQTTRTIADLLRDQGDFNAAFEAYAEAIDQFRKLDARAQLNDSLAGRAKAAGKLGRASEAIRVYRVLAHEYREAGNERKVAETLQSIGEQHVARGAQMQAAVEYHKALDTWKHLGSLSGMTSVRESLSMAYANVGNYKEASRLNALVLDGYKKQKARSNELIAEADRGWLQTGLGDYRGGLEIAENALVQIKDIGYAYGVMFVRNRIGWVRQQHYEYEAARKLYSETIDEARIAKDHGMLADTLRTRAAVSARLRDFDAARDDLDGAYTIARDTGAPGSLARIRLQLAHTERARGDFSAAHAAADEVIRLSREIGNLSSEAHGHRVKGLTWSAQYDSKRAEACFREALRLFADPDIQDAEETARTMLYLAGEYHEQGFWEKAERTAQQARTTAIENLAVDAMREGDMMLARMKRIRGELREALGAFEKIAEDPRLRDWEKPDLWLETAKLAHLLGTGELALEYIRKAQQLALERRNDWVASAAGIELSRILLSQGDYDAATGRGRHAPRARLCDRGTHEVADDPLDLRAQAGQVPARAGPRRGCKTSAHGGGGDLRENEVRHLGVGITTRARAARVVPARPRGSGQPTPAG